MIMNTKMDGTFMYSDSNKMGIFITATKKENEKEIYDRASKAYEDWMCGENESEYWTIGDYIVEELSIIGYEKEEDYYMFYDSDWD